MLSITSMVFSTSAAPRAQSFSRTSGMVSRPWESALKAVATTCSTSGAGMLMRCSASHLIFSRSAR
ncbi:hypothetical protein D3C84_803910 [compost metagenome]